MRGRGRVRLDLILGILLTGLNVLLLNLLLQSFRLPRIDLTEGGHYTMTGATRDILANLHQPVLIAPVEDVLQEFAAASDGRVRVRVIELDRPEHEAERLAAADDFGVRPVPLPVRTSMVSGIQNNYFSIVIAAGGEYEQYDLQKHFPLLFDVVERGDGTWEIQLRDLEHVLARAVRRVSVAEDSVAGALLARDTEAEAVFYLSPTEALPEPLAGLHEEVRALAERLATQSRGRFKWSVVDPYKGLTTSEARLEAARRLFERKGIHPIRDDTSDEERTFYAWLSASSAGRSEAVPLVTLEERLGPAELRDMVDGALRRLIPGFLPVLALVTPEPVVSEAVRKVTNLPPNEFTQVRAQLQEDWDIRPVDLARGDPIPHEAQVLLLIRPPELDDRAVFALDQFVMRGGSLVALADAFHMNPADSVAQGRIVVEEAPGQALRALLASWGAQVEPTMVEDTRSEYLPILAKTFVAGETGLRYDYVEYPFFLRLDRTARSGDHAVTASLARSGLLWAATAGPGEVPAGVTASTLITSSPEASTTRDTALARDVQKDAYRPPGNARTLPLAVALEGRFPSWFADRPIPRDGDGRPLATGAVLRRSEPTRIVIIGDADFVSYPVLGFFDLDAELIRENLQILANAVGWVGPDEGLMAIRNRPPLRRPLSGLAGLSPEERERAGTRTAWLDLLLTTGAVLACAGAWWLRQALRRPLVLPEEGS